MRLHLLLAGILGCGGGGGDQTPDAMVPDPTEAIFDPEHLLVIDIELAESDWDALRVQHHDFMARYVDDCPGPLTAEPYTVFPATVTIDGEAFEQVGLRMKGFLGSVNRTRPSLKLSFDEYEPGREVHGLERMTLNNNQQDHSQMDTCLTYQVFRAAGVPAPRCNWARVRVNGQDLGTFANVESVRRRFLARHFANSDGNLYEGQLADLRPVWIDNYEDKPGNDGDHGDLAALAEAVAAGPAAIDAELDVEAFVSFWAAEVLTGHWDGYAGNRNNHYLYRDPTGGKFHFLPWGPDAAFGIPSPFLPADTPPSLWANNVLTQALYADADVHAAYQARLAQLLDDVWDEDALVAEVDRVEAMLESHTHVTGTGFADGAERIRTFIRGRRQVIEDDVALDPVWDEPLPDDYCLDIIGTVTGTFSADIDDYPPTNVFGGSGTLEVTLNGTPVDFITVSAGAGPDNDPSHPRMAASAFGFINGGGGQAILPVMLVEPELWAAGELPVNGYEVFGILLRANSPTDLVSIGFLRGTLMLDAAPTTAGEPASGSFTLDVLGIDTAF